MTADVCLILEGTYPYVRGGVSAWTHEMVTRLDHLTFHVVSLLPRDETPEQQYQMPSNVIGHTVIHLQRLPAGSKLGRAEGEQLFNTLHVPLENITAGEAGVEDFRALLDSLTRHNGSMGAESLLNSEEAFNLVTRMYEDTFPDSSMLDYFWSWRAVVGGLYSLILPQLPEARVYHALSTGYAGLLAARARLEKRRPAIITEHGIYTNERRIEIALADWLIETSGTALTIDRTRRSLREFWMDTFTNYSRIAYEAADEIVTLFQGNQPAQLADGADASRMRIIPNGVDLQRFGSLTKREHARPTVAFIGRVVPIKDVKTYLRAVASLREMLPDIRAYVMGPTDEDAGYVEECTAIVQYLGLENNVTFTGQVRIEDYLPEVDVVLFSSISEAQPLVILEAGAAGIPTVATDVGACRELILGAGEADAALGAGGAVVPLANPQALAREAYRLLTDKGWYSQCSEAIRARVTTYYDKQDQMAAYKELYANHMRS